MDFLQVVGNRRSIRWPEPCQPVERDRVQRILEAARLTSCPGTADRGERRALGRGAAAGVPPNEEPRRSGVFASGEDLNLHDPKGHEAPTRSRGVRNRDRSPHPLGTRHPAAPRPEPRPHDRAGGRTRGLS
jgi:nitroreductase